MNSAILSMPSERRTLFRQSLESEWRRRRARRHLTDWAAWNGYQPAPHHRLLIDELEALTRGESDVLLVEMPPGSAKSTYVNLLFPAWYLAQKPDANILTASHSSELAERWGRRTRNLIAAESTTLGVSLSADSTAANRWGTTAGAEYYAVGVGVGIMGFRADCVVGDTIVETKDGPSRIDCLDLSAQTCYVLAYEEATKACAYKRVVAIARRKAEAIWRVRTASGRVVEATGNHRFWTGRGWIPAAALRDGDVLLRSMRRERGAERHRGCEAPRPSAVLREGVQHDGFKRQARAFAARLRDVWCRVAVQPIGLGQSFLFGRLQDGAHAERRRKAPRDYGARLRGLRRDVPPGQHHSAGALLFAGMQGRGTQGSDRWREEPRLASWAWDDAREPARLLQGEAGCLGSRWAAVRGVFGRLAARRSPHQSDAVRSPAGEPRFAVQELSPEAARGGEIEAEADAVSVVERVRRDCDVWDIQVEDAACFFANGVLVHNCGIIDDPFGSREDAESKRIRDNRWEWYVNDFSSRLKPGAKRVIMHQRWHEDDLAGRVIKQLDAIKKPYRRLKIRAEALLGDPLGRQPGEFLWDDPDGYNYGQFLRDRKAESDPRTWSALYQQEPTPDTGDFFSREWLHPTPTMPTRESLRVYGASDYAVTSGGGDYTVHAVVGIDSDKRLYLLDLWRQQADSAEWVEALCDLVRKWRPLMWAEETGQIRAGVGPFLARRMQEREAYVARKQFPTRGDKAVRAQSIRGRMAMGGLYVPERADWRAEFEGELLRFPAGVHDDQVDALGLIGQLLDTITAPAPPKEPTQAVASGYKSIRSSGGGSWRV